MGKEGSEVEMEEEVASKGNNESDGSESEGEDIEKAEGSKAKGSKIDAEEEGVGLQDEEGETDDGVQKSQEEGRNVEQEEAEMPCENTDEKVEESKEEEEAGDQKAGEEVETEIVVVDDLTSDEKGTPTYERTARRHSRQVKSVEEVAQANQPRTLRLRDEEETGDDIPQAQENPASIEDVSPAALEERYEAERKRKGKQEAKPHKKKPRQV